MMIMIVRKNLPWTLAATLLKLEMNLTMQHLLMSTEVAHNKFQHILLTIEDLIKCPPLSLSSLPMEQI
jgi:hypothetical protein